MPLARLGAVIVLHRKATRRSPTWHRAARKQRSKARKRLHTARSKGQTPAAKDLERLQSHHSQPVYREAQVPMGKRGQQSWEDTARYASWAASSQSSAWSGWPAKGKGKQWAEWKDDYHYRAKDSRDFPSYAAMPILGKEGGVPHSAVEPGSEQKLHPGASLAREVQRLVNGVRKSETRYRKAEEELAAEKARWHKFMDKMKKNFIQERSKYRASLGKLEKEMTDQQVAQEAAVQDLQKFLLQPVASPQADAATEEANAEWEELMKARKTLGYRDSLRKRLVAEERSPHNAEHRCWAFWPPTPARRA